MQVMAKAHIAKMYVDVTLKNVLCANQNRRPSNVKPLLTVNAFCFVFLEL